LVCTREEKEILSRNSRKSEQLLRKLHNTAGNSAANSKEEESLKKAQRRKETLLDYDVTHEKRTKVIDDESDYFSVDSNQWLSKDQRQKLANREKQLRESRHGSR